MRTSVCDRDESQSECPTAVDCRSENRVVSDFSDKLDSASLENPADDADRSKESFLSGVKLTDPLSGGQNDNTRR